ncbi:hypothetical protein PALB_20960 [Pseudoalteromonas luteoviolacea B = ATCC 29581]|nr:hypothetical protein PALB_20960 [Pseudoalteromonas luteoviolacea B = ATCC 29581]
MRAIGLLSFGYVPFIIIAAIVVGAISYVFSVFEMMNQFTSSYIDMSLLHASKLYAFIALVSSIAASVFIYFKRKVRSDVSLVSENHFQRSLIFFGSLYGLVIALLYTYISIQLSRFYRLDLVTLLAYIFQFIVLYHITTASWSLLRDAWQTKDRTLKMAFYFGLSVFALTVAIQ